MEIKTDDDSFGGSHDERLIFQETFFGNITDGSVANNKTRTGKCSNKIVSTSCEHAPLLTIKQVLLKDSKGRGSSKSKDSQQKKSSVGQRVYGKTCSKDALNSSVVQIGSFSTVLHPGSDSSSLQDTFQVVKYSLFSGSSGSSVSTAAAAEPRVNIVGEGGGQPNMVSNLEDNICKDSEAVRQVTSPTSQESTGSKAVLTTDGSNSKSIGNGNQEDDELLGDVSLCDARDQLFDAVTRLMGTKGWHVEVVQRTCRTYKEKNYIHEAQKRRVREFHKLWRLLGWTLRVNDNPGVVESNYKCWPDLGHYCKDLSLMLAQNDLTIYRTATDSDLARLWNILDPFVYVMYIYRKVRALRNATAIQSTRSIPLNAFVKYSGELTYDEITPVQKKKPNNKRKMQPSDSSLATNNASQNENAGGGGILNFGEMLREASNPKKSKKARCKTKVTSYQKDKEKFKNVEQRGDSAEMIIFEKVTGMDGSLFRSSLYDVHADSIKEWVSKNESTEQTKLVHEIHPDHMEIQIAVETAASQYLNKKDAILDSSGHNILQPYGFSLVEKEFLDSSNVAVSEDPYVRKKMLQGSMEESENDVHSLHNVAVLWKVQEYFTCGKKTAVEVDINTAVNKGRYFRLSNQIGGEMADDDILLSAIKNKTKKRGRPPKGGSASKLKVRSVKSKPKGRGRGRKLHPRSGGKGGHQEEDEKCITSGARTPLSWLIDSGVVNLESIIVYREPRSNDVVKQGFLTKDGILCDCCGETYSVSNFRLHAGAKSSGGCSNLFMESGTPYSLCQLNGWSPEYLKRKNHKKPTQLEDEDEGDDICGLCGDGGDLVCCDNCPATFHKNCLSAQELPEGDWYCFSCVCYVCGEFSRAGSTKRLKCAQCEHKYHAACIMDEIVTHDVTDDWFCSKSCHNIHSDIRSRVGVMVPLANGYSSTLLRCSHDDDDGADEKPYSHTQMSYTFKEDCHTKLAVALTIMEECFLSMIDTRTGIDMIPHMVYNFGSTFPRLDFHGFYTVILEKDDVIVCVATLRIHGSSVAEIPLVATCSKYRRQGMCRLLMGSIEEMLKALKIEKIVMSAVPELVPTWVNGFGFQPVEDDEKSSLKKLNLVVFPGTVSLKKILIQSEPMLQVKQPVSSADAVPVPNQVPGTNVLQLSDWHAMWSEPDAITRHLMLL